MTIELPDREDLCSIFRFYLKRDLTDCDLMPFALAARGGTGADVEAWVRRARSQARRSDRAFTAGDILQEIRGDRSVIPSRLRNVVCIHEAGHAVVGVALHYAVPDVVWLTDRGGRTVVDFDPSSGVTLHGLENEMTTLLAGRAAEQTVLGVGGVTTGAGSGDQSDLVRATQIAFDIEVRFGLGECGLIRLPDSAIGARMHDQAVQAAIERRLKKCLNIAEAIVGQHQGAIKAIADSLDAHGYLERETLHQLLLDHGLGDTRVRTQ